MVEIFPNSPMWADISRLPDWNPERIIYDTGKYQGSTAKARPFYSYTITGKNYNELFQSSLQTFFENIQMIDPFFVKDPYDYHANNVTQVTSTNMGVGSGFYFTDSRGWQFVPDSAFLYMEDANTGEVVNGVDFVMSLDNGWIDLLTPISSIWVSSTEFFRKVVLTNQPSERSNIWNNFSTTIVIKEILPN